MNTSKFGIFFTVVSGLLMTANVAAADEPAVSIEQRVMPVERFVKEMQLLSRRVPVGATKLEKSVSLEKLQQEIHDQFDGTLLEYEARIESVDWNHGMATIKARSPIRSHKGSRPLPFTFTMFQPLKIPMTQEEAAKLPTRKPLLFRGTLNFLKGKTVVHGQQPKLYSVFWIRHSEYKPLNTVGAFVTEDYSVSLGDDEIFSVHPDQDAE